MIAFDIFAWKFIYKLYEVPYGLAQKAFFALILRQLDLHLLLGKSDQRACLVLR